MTYLALFYGPQYGASATAGARMLSYYLGVAFPLFSIPSKFFSKSYEVFLLIQVTVFEGLGIAWALSLLGFVGAALMPTPFVLHRYGAQLRARSSRQV